MILSGGAMFLARRLPDFAGSIGIHDRNADPDNQIGPDRQRVSSQNSGGDDRDIGQRIVARGEKRGFGQAPAVMPETRKQECAG